MNAENTIFGVVRLLGRQFSDVQSNLVYRSVQVKADPAGRPVYVVESEGATEKVTPEDVVVELLKCMCVPRARRMTTGRPCCCHQMCSAP